MSEQEQQFDRTIERQRVEQGQGTRDLSPVGLAGRQGGGERGSSALHLGPDPHRRASALSDIILGGQDGLVNVLGVVLGVAAATQDTRIVLVAGLAATFAELVSMGAVAYTSTLADADVFESERSREYRHIKRHPHLERDEVREIYQRKGFSGDLLDQIVETITANPDVWVAVMMAEEHQLEPVDRRVGVPRGVGRGAGGYRRLAHSAGAVPRLADRAEHPPLDRGDCPGAFRGRCGQGAPDDRPSGAQWTGDGGHRYDERHGGLRHRRAAEGAADSVTRIGGERSDIGYSHQPSGSTRKGGTSDLEERVGGPQRSERPGTRP